MSSNELSGKKTCTREGVKDEIIEVLSSANGEIRKTDLLKRVRTNLKEKGWGENGTTRTTFYKAVDELKAEGRIKEERTNSKMVFCMMMDSPLNTFAEKCNKQKTEFNIKLDEYKKTLASVHKEEPSEYPKLKSPELVALEHWIKKSILADLVKEVTLEVSGAAMLALSKSKQFPMIQDDLFRKVGNFVVDILKSTDKFLTEENIPVEQTSLAGIWKTIKAFIPTRDAEI